MFGPTKGAQRVSMLAAAANYSWAVRLSFLAFRSAHPLSVADRVPVDLCLLPGCQLWSIYERLTWFPTTFTPIPESRRKQFLEGCRVAS